MKKTTSFTFVLLLLLFVLGGSLPAIVQGVYHVGVTWGSPYNVEYDEQVAASNLCSDIRGIFDDMYPTWVANNFYGPSTYASNVYQCSDSVKSSPSYDYLATFHVGHMFPDMVPYGHYEIIGYWQGIPIWVWVIDGYVRHYAYYSHTGSYYGIRDYLLYPHTGYKHYFTFLWTCTLADLMDLDGDGDGDEYGYWDVEHGTGKVGMPYAWTQTTSLSQDGYGDPISSNFCYIGFENVSKRLTGSFEGSASYNYADFIRRFYYHAIIDGDSINVALDRATSDMNVGMTRFDSAGNDLYYGWWEDVEGFEYDWFSLMRVYGDGTNELGVVG